MLVLVDVAEGVGWDVGHAFLRAVSGFPARHWTGRSAGPYSRRDAGKNAGTAR